jgi:hypothetical protein
MMKNHVILKNGFLGIFLPKINHKQQVAQVRLFIITSNENSEMQYFFKLSE